MAQGKHQADSERNSQPARQDCVGGSGKLSAACPSLMCPQAIVACWRKPDQGKAQDAAPHFSPTGTGRGGESGKITYTGMWT
jgi:hypothetical protein